MNVYLYTWSLDKDGKTIRAYGVDVEGRTICVVIKEFNPYLYVEVPFKDKDSIRRLSNFINTNFRCLRTICKVKQKLYGGERCTFLKCYFKDKVSLYTFKKRFEAEKRPGVHIHEANASILLQFCTENGIDFTGWVKLTHVEPSFERYTTCDEEWCATSHSVFRKSDLITIPLIKVLSWDIETNSADINKFPTGNHPEDKVFQISAIFKQGENITKYLLSLFDPDQDKVGKDCTILKFETEYDLLLGFADLIYNQRPQITIGWNIFQFDFNYLLQRSKYLKCFPKFMKQSYLLDDLSLEKTIKWSSKAYGDQNITLIESEGIVHIDLMNVVQKSNYRLDNYKLNTVSGVLLNESKVDLSAYEMFKYYRKGDPVSLGIVGNYCIQDSVLVLKLYEEMKTWLDLSEMAIVCFTTINIVHLQGQQIKFFHQLYKYCHANDIVVTTSVQDEDDSYAGAYCFPPKPGMYDNVVPLDFASLYPSLIIAYNIDYTTYAPDAPDSECHVFEWEDHLNCEHDPKVIRKNEIGELLKNTITKAMKAKLIKERANLASTSKTILCKIRKFKFLKEPKGVLPTIIQRLLETRANVRIEMKTISDPFYKSLLDKKQNSLKVTANSMYGATGAKKGYLPFLPIAMCVTHMGRTIIQNTAKLLSERDITIIYGDTDSNYVTFKEADNLWEKSITIAKEISVYFPRPLTLEFENVIYKKFILLTKKRYIYMHDDFKIGYKGVILARRDNCKFIKDVYLKIVKMILKGYSKDEVLDEIAFMVYKLYSRQVSFEDLVITKNINDYGDDDMVPVLFENDKGIIKGKLGNYTVPGNAPLNEPKEWYQTKLPAQVQLELKIKKRGHQRDEGSRISYVICDIGFKGKQYQKIESYSYFIKHSSILKIDYGYYIERLIQPLDQLLETIWGISTFTKDLHKFYSINKVKLLHELHRIFKPKIFLNK